MPMQGPRGADLLDLLRHGRPRRGLRPGPGARAGQGATRPFASNAAAVIGMRGCQWRSICSATISISRCGKEGNLASSRFVRSERKFISERAFIVTYIDE